MTTTVTATKCQWIGEGELCSHTALEGSSYCAEHYARVYQKGTARAKRKKDIRVANTVWDLESEFNAAVQELIEEGYDPADERWDAEVELE